MLTFETITKIFKSELFSQPFVALDNVSFTIPSGSMVGFLGANGAGKTTSLKIIMDFIRADSGRVDFSSELGKTRSEIFKNIGFLPERPYFYPNLSGNDFLLFMGLLSELPRSTINERVKKWAPRFKIDYALNRELKTYSKGMLQRIGFLATILHEPDLIILDEPLSGLDPIGRKELKDVIIEVHREGKTVFFSSHIIPDIEEICDRVIFLKEGKLVYDGSVDKLLSSERQQQFVIKYKNSDALTFQVQSQTPQAFPGNLFSVVVSEDNKNNLIKETLSQGAEIVSLELIKPSLEEIFYHTKGQ